jgi:hypothetical protein
MRKQKPFVDHHGVTIYETFKGRNVQRYWYALEPRQNEGSDQKFDIRRLPKAYRSDLLVEYSQKHGHGAFDTSSEEGVARFFEVLEEERGAHKTALQRAIDDEYDFSSAARENYGQFFRRFFRYVQRRFANQRIS